ncbi:MAG: hypothetical protein WCS17_01750 [Prevotella sp.]
MKALSEAERLDYLIEALENGSAAKFAKKIGFVPNRISRIRSGELRLTPLIQPILKAYPQVSYDWLRSGIGYPGDLNPDLEIKRLTLQIRERDVVIYRLSKEIDAQRILIAKLGKKT